MLNRLSLFASLIVFLFIQPLPRAESAEKNPASDFAGLWVASRNFTPDVRGTLRVIERDGDFHAEIAGHSVKVAIDGKQLRFEIPDERGYFRGSFDGNRIKGHWVQPRTQSNFAQYASPVYLQPAGLRQWQGDVTPLDDTLRFYLRLEPGEDGSLKGFIRNPEANIGRFYPIEQVVREDDRVQFIDGDGRVRLEGIYHETDGQLSMYFPYNGGTYDFVRADEVSGARFFPRPKSDAPYEYTQPVPAEGWETAHLNDVGIAVEPVEELMRFIIDTPMDAIDAPYIHGFLLARHGKLALEEYFHGYSRDLPHGTRSASKTITATLAGIGVYQGMLSLDTPVYETMYDGALPDTLDKRAERMVLEHLISMTPGLACDDFNQESPGNEDTMQNQEDQPDWFQYTLDLPMLHEPGDVAAYCSGSQNLAGGVVAKATAKWLPEFYRDYFAAPLDMGHYHMNLSPTGEGYGGGGLLIKGRDFLKLGQLFLDGGKWQDQQIISQEWVRNGTDAINDIRDEGYGYGWWIFSYDVAGREIKAFYAGGNGGQYVIVIPELDLNIVIFAGNYNQRVMHKPKYEYVRDYILPAIPSGD